MFDVRRRLAVSLLSALLACAAGGADAADYMNNIGLRLIQGETYTIRISLWKDGRLRAGDLSDGAIAASAPMFAGYQAETEEEADAAGVIRLHPSAFPAFPEISLGNMFLMVETKVASEPLASYAVYRSPSFAGTALDRYPLLETTEAQLSLLYGNYGTVNQIFVIDVTGKAGEGGTIALQFGNLLKEKLLFDVARGRFVFTNDLRVEGNLGVLGDTYLAADHAATESPGILHMGREAGGWEWLEWDPAGSTFHVSDALKVEDDLSAASVTLPSLPNCASLGTDEEGRIVCKGRR